MWAYNKSVSALFVCDKLQTLSMRFFQVVVDSSPAEKNALRTVSRYCVTSSPVSYTPSVASVVGRILCCRTVSYSGDNICKSVL